MLTHRCYNCRRFLFDTEGEGEIEVICPGCRTINYCGRDNLAIGKRGMSFQIASVELRCPDCDTLLGRALGEMVIKTKCKFCKQVVSYSTITTKKVTETSILVTPNKRT